MVMVIRERDDMAYARFGYMVGVDASLRGERADIEDGDGRWSSTIKKKTLRYATGE